MEILIAIMACLVAVSFLLKVGFFPMKGLVAVAFISAAFTAWVVPRMTELPHDAFIEMCTNRNTLLNLAVCVVLEAVVMIAFCFATPRTRWMRLLLCCYPGMLFAAAICYFLAQLLFLMPGVGFELLRWISALAALLFVVGGSTLLRRALGNRPARQEMLFIINLLILILCVAITGY
ncbi:MAG: hypothetical protein IJ604_14830 [Prevotella sp.]|nr:hypothetical protein [Prevotella sp.]MBR1464635.1 hypothetical protein [Prevotella sp.]